jgi:cephalosporin hydroxylase
MNSIPEHQTSIPGNQEFETERQAWRNATAEDSHLRATAIDFQVACSAHNYTYQFEWMGVPIIRLPDDIVILQELIWSLKPSKVIETGIARGGSLILSASLMKMTSGHASVLGLDLQIFPHTKNAIENSQFADSIKMWEGDSSSASAVDVVKEFLKEEDKPCLLILDSDHTHSHVLNELNALAPLLPAQSIVMVADTLIEELPVDFYSDREWAPGNNPLTALNEFLAENGESFKREFQWGRRAVQSEFRDGIISKIS